MLQFYSCFISYSHKDKKFATKLHDKLQKEGICCWLDDHQILPGDDIYQEVDRGIRLWDKVLLCCSESSLTSWWVDNEIISTFDKEQDLMSERGEKIYSLIPINWDDYLFSSNFKRGYRNQIKSRLAANSFDWEANIDLFKYQVSSLVKALQVGNTKRDFVPEPLL
ncbi:MAG: hypothetical protein ACI9Y1_001812 [Lentisphaeria bacterium]|jgi:hypothetical protein